MQLLGLEEKQAWPDVAVPAAPMASAVAPADAELARTLRMVSILFLDVVGSTSLSQVLDAEEVHSVKDGALAGFTVLVRAHGGRVLQYAGDSLLASFGAGEVREDDAERAVRCGLALLVEGRSVGQRVRSLHGHAGFDVRVDVHTGEVLLGGGVDAQHAFDVHATQPLRIKGVEAPVIAYRVEAERPRSARAVRHGFKTGAAPMVGRHGELAQLHAALAAAQLMRLQQRVVLIGEAGLGKTRLVNDFEAALTKPGSVATVLRASKHPQGLHQPYGVIRDLLFRRFDVQDSDSLTLAQAKLAEGLAPWFGEQALSQPLCSAN